MPENKPCKEWKGAHSKAGYAQRYYRGKVWYLHRLVFLQEYGYLPKVVRHTCDNPGCWEIAHLVGGTYLDNSRDMVERGRSHGLLKLTAEDVEKIIERYLAGEKSATIAHDFNLHKNYVYKLVGKRHPEIVRSRVGGKGRWMPGKEHGPSIRKGDSYEALKDKGFSKSKAAAISNAQAQGKSRRHAMGEKAADTRESGRKPMPKTGEAKPTKSKYNKPENRGK